MRRGSGGPLPAPLRDREAVLAPWKQIAWLARGTPPGQIGWGLGPLTAARRLAHRRLRRPLRLTLLEHSDNGTRFAAPHAFFINERSRICTARVNDTGPADVVWIFSQDPLPASARRSLQAAVDALRPAVVLNRVAAYDAYHEDEAFDRLEANGVRVPRTRFTHADLGSTPTVYKARREQPARKVLEPYRGEMSDFKAFAYVDGRGPDGLARRYRAFWFCGRVLPKDVFVSAEWEVNAATSVRIEDFRPTEHEREQITLLARTLGLDFFAVDFLRRRPDGLPVFVDVNVYPTIVTVAGNEERGERGQWHVWDNARRLGSSGPDPWHVFDEVLREATDA